MDQPITIDKTEVLKWLFILSFIPAKLEYKYNNNDLKWEVNIQRHLRNRSAKLGESLMPQFQYQEHKTKREGACKKFVHEVKSGKAW
jgi:hypothetical protein